MYPAKPTPADEAAPAPGVPVAGPGAGCSTASTTAASVSASAPLSASSVPTSIHRSAPPDHLTADANQLNYYPGCLTCWCPCITFARVAEIVDRGASSCGTSGALYGLLAAVTGWTCQWVYSCAYRQKMRAQFGLADAPCCDCCVHFCCEPCALCKEYKELKARGFDPVLGWHLTQQQQMGR